MNILQLTIWQNIKNTASKVDRKVILQSLSQNKGSILICLAILAALYLTHRELKKRGIVYKELPTKVIQYAHEVGVFLVSVSLNSSLLKRPSQDPNMLKTVVVQSNAQGRNNQLTLQNPITLTELFKDQDKPIRGFNRLTQDQYVRAWVEKFCEENNAVCMEMLTDDNEKLITFDMQDVKREVFLVNKSQHYSVIVYMPDSKAIFRYNSKYKDLNSLEKKIIELIKKTDRLPNESFNQQIPQQDGWSCAFQVFNFLEKLFCNNTMQQIEKFPLDNQRLVELINEYYSYLLKKQLEIPSDNQIFYQILPEESSKLASHLQTVCNGAGETKEYFGQSAFIVKKEQLETILVKIFELNQQNHKFLEEVITLLKLTHNQRRFLDQALRRVEWTKEMLVNQFFSSYVSIKGTVLSPD